MRRTLPILPLLFALLPIAVVAQRPAATTTAIKAARLFDGQRRRGSADAVVIVEGSTITAVGSRLPVPAAATGHRSWRCDTAARIRRRPHALVRRERPTTGTPITVAGLRRTVAESALRASEFARRTLLAGFTTVRDVGGGDYIDVGLRNAIDCGIDRRAAHAGRGPRARRARRALRQRRLSLSALRRRAGHRRGHRQRSRSVPRRGALPGEVRRGRDQGVRDRRRALARRRCGRAAAHAGRDGRAGGRGAPARAGEPRRTRTARRGRRWRSAPASTRSSTARSSTTRRCG